MGIVAIVAPKAATVAGAVTRGIARVIIQAEIIARTIVVITTRVGVVARVIRATIVKGGIVARTITYVLPYSLATTA